MSACTGVDLRHRRDRAANALHTAFDRIAMVLPSHSQRCAADRTSPLSVRHLSRRSRSTSASEEPRTSSTAALVRSRLTEAQSREVLAWLYRVVGVGWQFRGGVTAGRTVGDGRVGL